MRRKSNWIILMIIFCSVIGTDSFLNCVSAQTPQTNPRSAVIQPVMPPQGFGVQDTGRTTNQAYPGGFYPFDTATSSQANWALVAWSNPTNKSYLNPFINFPTFDQNQKLTGQTWLASSSQNASQNLAVIINQNLTSGINSQILLQDGLSNLSGCSDSYGNPVEYDFFVFPNSQNINPYYNSAYLPNTTNPSLDKITGININGSVEILAQLSTSTPGQCVINQSSMLYSLIFSNPTSGQTFFYQLNLNFFCYPGTNAAWNSWCSATIPQTNYFFTGAGNVWGIDDQITNYVNPTTKLPYSFLQNSGNVNLEINFLPRIASLIQNAQYGMDKNLSHWQLGGMYYGQHTWGNAALISNWSSVNFSPTIVYNQ